MHRLGRDALWIMTHPDVPVDYDEVLQAWTQRRAAHEPLEYILQEVSFYSETFYIAPGALIPRPETEILIDKTLEAAHGVRTLCEVGVGSGAVSVMLARLLPDVKIIAVDVSEEALEVARVNVQRFGLASRIELRRSDLLDAVPEPIDLLVSNPPYVARNADLEASLDYEPALALFGGEVGDEMIARLIDTVFERRIPLFTCEMGYDQRARVAAICADRPGASLSFYTDLAGLDRGFSLTLKESKCTINSGSSRYT